MLKNGQSEQMITEKPKGIIRENALLLFYILSILVAQKYAAKH